MYIRSFRIGDEHALHAVFYSAIHRLASKNYTPEQIEAWAPLNFDHEMWASRMQGIQPFVVEHAGQIVAYADVQANGYIDHFFVAASHARLGVGSTLMNHIHDVANGLSITVLSSDVSLTAQPFFEKFGFTITEQRSTVIRGVVVPNALMHKELVPNSSIERTSPSNPGGDNSHDKR
ncbi:MAG: GNAT family N-acetyltransferase [Limisphaerales bacterium]